MMSYGDEAPIAALATVPGVSALALIRTSGKNALDLLSRVFSRPQAIREAPGNTLVHGWIINPAIEKGEKEKKEKGEKIDDVLVSVYRAPRSYTGEDGADISCHGGTATVKALLRVLHGAGFRGALPGEFTFRAFINGKLDLTQAEAVMELVSAKTDGARGRAVSRLAGSLEKELGEIKRLLARVLAGVELRLDYAEDELEDEDAEHLPERSKAEEALGRLNVLARSYRRERLYQEGALVVIAGKPNAGKSSLFNRLLNEERAIVAETPGTTRDWIEGWISLEGVPIRLADTAGLRDSRDRIEENGVSRTRELLSRADGVLYLIDGTRGIAPEDAAFLAEPPGPAGVIGVWNKIDAAPLLPRRSLVGISAKTGQGIEELTRALMTQITSFPSILHGQEQEPPGIATERQKACIDAAAAHIAEGLALADTYAPLDLMAPLFREGINALGEITGQVSTAEILEVMFGAFCVGK